MCVRGGFFLFILISSKSDPPPAHMKLWKRCLLFLAVSGLFLHYSPTLLDINPEAYSIPFLPFVGPLAINDRLDAAEHLFENEIYGPESIVFHKGEMYTGTEDGQIIKIVGNKIIPVARLGRECEIPWEEQLCGRPLGLRIGKDGLLYITDAYYGLHTMNFTTGLLTRLLPTSVSIEGKKITFPDDMDIDEEGNIYFSDASTKWKLFSIYYLFAEFDGSGRILKYHLRTGETEVLLRNLHFPNGVQISHDGKSILICEVLQRRILKYHIKGPKKGQQEVFVDQLPGEPDNIRPSPRGGYWVALTFARNSTHQMTIDRISEYPIIKRLWARSQHAIGSLLMAMTELWQSPVFKEIAYRTKRADVIIPLVSSKHGIIIELDKDGNILRSFHSPSGKTSLLSQVTEHDGYLYLGSFVNRYLGRLKL